MWLIFCIDILMLINVIIIVISLVVKKYRQLRLIQTAAITGIVALFNCVVNTYAIATNKLDLGFPDWVYIILLLALLYAFVVAVIAFVKFKKSLKQDFMKIDSPGDDVAEKSRIYIDSMDELGK